MKFTQTNFNKAIKGCFLAFLCITLLTSCFFNMDSIEPINPPAKPEEDNGGSTPIYSEYVQDFYIDNFGEIPKGTNYINIDFTTVPSQLDGNYKTSNDELYAKWHKNTTRASNVLKDEHGRVCLLEGDPRKVFGNSSYLQLKVECKEDSTVTFQFKSDMFDSNCLHIQLDNEKPRVIGHKGNGERWLKASIFLPKGTHTLKWFIPKMNKYSPDLLNVIYLDNITIAPNKVHHIELYPKGDMETSLDGFPIKYSAIAFRSDGTVIPTNNIKYSVTGCGTIDKNGLFTPKYKGKGKVTASINGSLIAQSNLEVHGHDYLSDDIIYANNIFTGEITNDNGHDINGDLSLQEKFEYPSPKTNRFSADGFFILKGKTKVPLYIRVQKNGTEYKTTYLVRKSGDFYKRIWLRFGEGDYTVSIGEAPNMVIFNPLDPKYEGDFAQASVSFVNTLHVHNVNKMTLEDALWLMPSEIVQTDSYLVRNAAKTIQASLPMNYTKGDYIRRAHDWVIHNLHYDNISANHNGRRKRQDAEHVIKYEMGVCEGYSNLFAALLRYEGIPTKVIGNNDMGHAWNQVFYNGQWYLVDTTWDDPVSSKADDYEDKNICSENYTYFMTSLTDNSHISEGNPIPERSILIPSFKGMPDGWY